jgi:plasmid stabilization system protein ParE
MKLVYSRQALADLSMIATSYAPNASPEIAESIKRRLGDVMDRISRVPKLLRASRNALRSVSQLSFGIRSGFFAGYAATPSTFCIFDTHRGGLRAAIDVGR